MSRFTLPRDIYYGKNSLETLRKLKGNPREVTPPEMERLLKSTFYGKAVDF
ncbi:MAG: hypothetical protein LBL05_09745 [Synergistaceae bacterium]|jgi:hypothetical protein|nr:hypothetical protein [Synergistaceae bacterium]